mgnify:CR=1 FL=1
MVQIMLDSGATGNFIDHGMVNTLQIPIIQKDTPEEVQAVDGKPLSSGPLTEHTTLLQLRVVVGEEQHTERVQFNVIDAPQYGIILGMPWLHRHNPLINWVTRSVQFPSLHCRQNCLTPCITPERALAMGYRIATAAEKDVELPAQYMGFQDVFSPALAEELPPHRRYDCQIDLLPGALIPSCRIYALSEKETKHLREYLDKYLENGFIRPSRSPAASPLFFIPKDNGELRTCIDYRVLNKNTVRNRYPLPLISVMLDQVKRARIYTRLDLRGANHLVRIRQGDEWKTAFKTCFGLFEYLVMPFGLCNAPVRFQFFLNDVLKDYLDLFVVVYIDDILIYSDNEQLHAEHVCKLLQVLRKHHLFCKLSKCEFHVQEVEFLGVILIPFGLRMAKRKVQAVQDWATPGNLREVQCFLGFANYYRWFINHFSQVVAPISHLLRKKVPFIWSVQAEDAFVYLKRAFSTAPVLAHPNPDEAFIVEADASEVALGAILSQRNGITGHLHPVAYMSRKLSGAELNYTVAEKELLAIKGAFKEWRHYLWGAKHTVTVYTDHRNLQFMKTVRLLTPRQLRWMQFFAEYEFVVTYRPGKENGKADALSRKECSGESLIRPEQSILDPAQVVCMVRVDNFLESVKIGRAHV